VDLKIVLARCKLTDSYIQYGSDEVVSRAILGWLFEGESSQLEINVENEKGDKQHRAVLTFKQIHGLWESRIDPRVSNGDVTIHVSIEKVV